MNAFHALRHVHGYIDHNYIVARETVKVSYTLRRVWHDLGRSNRVRVDAATNTVRLFEYLRSCRQQTRPPDNSSRPLWMLPSALSRLLAFAIGMLCPQKIAGYPPQLQSIQPAAIAVAVPEIGVGEVLSRAIFIFASCGRTRKTDSKGCI